ncbi:MAG: DUF4136 domain-containing protein [Verrucomicrobiae bacterium]|nr:DUF4136 domain-containing protein [Verrucomicrobiae bacterium]
MKSRLILTMIPVSHRTQAAGLVRHFLHLAAILCVVAGCSTPSRVDTGTIHATTFSFMPGSTRPVPGYADNRTPIHDMIQSAITRNLEAKGLRRMDSGGEVLVGYLVIVGNNATTAAVDDYFGSFDDREALHSRAHDAYTGGKTPHYFEAGTLVIDLRDAKTFDLLRRGYATRPLLRDIPESTRSGRIQEVVDEILVNLKVAP